MILLLRSCETALFELAVLIEQVLSDLIYLLDPVIAPLNQRVDRMRRIHHEIATSRTAIPREVVLLYLLQFVDG